jgi:hypothetical protein
MWYPLIEKVVKKFGEMQWLKLLDFEIKVGHSISEAKSFSRLNSGRLLHFLTPKNEVAKLGLL